MKKCWLKITLEIEGDESEALAVVDRLLDAGELQDAINEWPVSVGKLKVLSALVATDEP